MTISFLEVLVDTLRSGEDRSRVTFVDSGYSLSIVEMLRRVDAIARSMRDLGLAKGDRVALSADASDEYILLWMACLYAGHVSVPIDPSAPDTLREQVLTTTGSSCVLVGSQHEDSFVDMPCPAIKFGDLEQGGVPDKLFLSLMTDRLLDHRPSDLASIMFTSGTTGHPKGVMVTYGSLSAMAESAGRAMSYCRADRIHNCLPLHHINPIVTGLLPSFLAGATFIAGNHFSVRGFWQELASTGATTTTMVGSMAELLLNAPADSFARKHKCDRALIVPAPSSYWESFPAKFDITPIQLYGLTDAGHVLIPDEATPPGSSGKPAEEFECRLIDSSSGLDVVPEQPGELVVRPTRPWVMGPGYWQDPDATLEAWTDWWFHTGDAFRRTRDGNFFFHARLTDSMRTRGENVSAFEVERALMSYGSIVEAAAYPVPSELLEDDIAAAIVVSSDCQIEASDLIQHLRSKLPKHAVPRFIRIVEELPRTSTHKVQKTNLRQEGVTGDMIELTSR